MAYYHPYSYTYSPSSGWEYGIQAGPSTLPYTPYTEEASRFGSPIHADASPYDIPISRYSTLTGALTPVDSTPQEGGVQPFGPVPQQAPLQPVPYTLAGPVQSQAAQPVLAQPRQPVNPQLVAPPHQGVPTHPVAPQPAPSHQRRTAYQHAKPPARHPRQPAGVARFCLIGGCAFSTTDRGKRLSRHRAAHFPGQVGVVCPSCGKIFSRSNTCGAHLRACDPQLWHTIASTKGTQDSWGERIGQDLVRPSLVDGS